MSDDGYDEIDLELDVLAEVFGEPDERSSHPERGYHVFKYERPDGTKILLSVDIYERTASIAITTPSPDTSVGIRLGACTQIRVLDPKMKILEILSHDPSTRCYLSLNAPRILDASIPSDDNARA